MGKQKIVLRLCILALSGGLTIIPVRAQFVQQGGKLAGYFNEGASVALSADGNTVIIGAPGEDTTGAALVYTRKSGVWTLQGKLVGTGAVWVAAQGSSVSISADGNTAIVGGNGDDSSRGAAWVFSRTQGIWTQQGPKLVGKGAVGRASQGQSVALSADGNTAIIGGPADNSDIGAIWVFTRHNCTWTQEGGKLVGAGAVGNAYQGSSVSISADGNTTIVGGKDDNSGEGAAWVFIRKCFLWIQQGNKLVGSGEVGTAPGLGTSVALSADGNRAVAGGEFDNSRGGSVWAFTRKNCVWTQQGSKFAGTDAGAVAFQGHSISLAADGNTVIFGGWADGSLTGAAWVFTRTGDVWNQFGAKLVGSGATERSEQGTSVSISADGNTVASGGPFDNLLGGPGKGAGVGAVWIYSRPPSATCCLTVPQGSTAAFPFPGTGVTLQFPTANTGNVILTVQRFNCTPGGDVRMLGLTGTAPLYWAISVDSGTINGKYNIALDLTGISGINSCGTLHLLEREYASYPWSDLGTPSDTSGEPGTVVWSGLTSFSQFTLGSGSDNPLPIQLASFAGKVAGTDAVYLEWSTASEVNCYGFEIQRGPDANRGFSPLPEGFLAGHGTTGETHLYMYTDRTARSGEWVYRLKEIDLDGTIHFSETLEVDIAAETAGKDLPAEFSLGQNYPNPFNPSTIIAIGLPRDARVSLEVFNTLGQKVEQLLDGMMTAGYHRVVFDASRLAGGVYFYRMLTGSFVQTRKLLLIK